jgi:hypothetical protein
LDAPETELALSNLTQQHQNQKIFSNVLIPDFAFQEIICSSSDFTYSPHRRWCWILCTWYWRQIRASSLWQQPNSYLHKLLHWQNMLHDNKCGIIPTMVYLSIKRQNDERQFFNGMLFNTLLCPSKSTCQWPTRYMLTMTPLSLMVN